MRAPVARSSPCAGSVDGIAKSLQAAEQDRPDVAARRDGWRTWQRYMDQDRFVFPDQTGAATNMIRR